MHMIFDINEQGCDVSVTSFGRFVPHHSVYEVHGAHDLLIVTACLRLSSVQQTLYTCRIAPEEGHHAHPPCHAAARLLEVCKVLQPQPVTPEVLLSS
jgi:hypothetical protein